MKPPRRSLRIGKTLGVAVAALGLQLVAGCISVENGGVPSQRGRGVLMLSGWAVFDTDQEKIPETDDWPARWGDASGPNPDIKGVIVEETRPLKDLGVVWLWRTSGLRPDSQDLRDAAAVSTLGDTPNGVRARFERSGGVVLADLGRFVPPWGERRWELLGGPGAPVPQRVFRFVSAEEQRGEGVPSLDVQRTWLAWYEPSREEIAETDVSGAKRKTAVVMPGLFGEPVWVMNRFVNELLDDGWCVLRVLAPPSRYVEREEVLLHGVDDLAQGDEAPMRGTGKRLAEMFDTRFAEYAYAVEAGTRYVDAELSGTGPFALVAMSGGVWAAPAAIARMDTKPRAVVFIAGGADALSVGMRSSYTETLGTLILKNELGDYDNLLAEDVGPLVLWYLDQSKLDPMLLPGVLAGIPTLMLHAEYDKIVPASQGDILWESLRKPERWTLPTGHLGLFLTLPMYDQNIVDWLNERFDAPEHARVETTDGTSPQGAEKEP